jgi:hypothetical protein
MSFASDEHKIFGGQMISYSATSLVENIMMYEVLAEDTAARLRNESSKLDFF